MFYNMVPKSVLNGEQLEEIKALLEAGGIKRR
jgi:hypothetical protein